ncbi:hypothetical protein EV193_107108 [Herbihabitans rhizosphaerae]|uniref:Uncharacterized protein n=1 Tax=Herbihabitans rhizosphaerae TaxID=1872711 RepID=A0A4Q7KJQ7_9PSEU|nr:hypothetical protein EV193_107108 [Herbihabitans rhizosphaerae]
MLRKVMSTPQDTKSTSVRSHTSIVVAGWCAARTTAARHSASFDLSIYPCVVTNTVPAGMRTERTANRGEMMSHISVNWPPRNTIRPGAGLRGHS